ncbi:MAG: amidohydrolase family protein [Streptosporangiales bacterium]
MIVDFHTHIDEVPALGWHLSAEMLLGQMDEAGVDRAVVMPICDAPEVDPGGTERLADTCRRSGGRLVPMVRVHPWYDEATGIVADAVERLGAVGVKLHGVTTITDPGSPAVVRIIEKAASLGVPVLFHSGDEAAVTPLELAAAAAAVPEATVVFAHIGGYAHAREALDVASELPNVYLDTSATPHVGAVAEAVSRLGAHRVLYGSDAPGCPMDTEITKVRLSGLSEDDERTVLGGAALRLLGAA